jgi:hypothetical protein
MSPVYEGVMTKLNKLTLPCSQLPKEIYETFGLKEEEPGTKLAYDNFTQWIPLFSRANQPCAYCKGN